MSAPNSIDHMLTKEELWSALCQAVSHTDAEMVGPLATNGGAWGVSRSMDPEAKNIAQLFLPLLGPIPADRPLVVGHLAQSLDGYIAKVDGESHWISGPEDLDHTHRLRAFCDAVLVGARTVSRDDCRLTVRRCEGSHPLRVVLDPSGALDHNKAVFQQQEGAVLHVVSTPTTSAPGVEQLTVASTEGHFDLKALCSVLHQRGVRRLFIEGGGVTITRFLMAGLLDRLHLAIAPILLGHGRPGFAAPFGRSLSESPRPSVAVIPMGNDWLFDCDLGSET